MSAAMEATPRTEPGPFENLVTQEWNVLLEKDDRTSPEEYPDMCLIDRRELACAMTEAFIFAKDQSSPMLAELLEALKLATSWIDNLPAANSSHQMLQHHIDSFKAAIAKAEGPSS